VLQRQDAIEMRFAAETAEVSECFELKKRMETKAWSQPAWELWSLVALKVVAASLAISEIQKQKTNQHKFICH